MRAVCNTLHVATAALARATAFLAFDKNQRVLAASVGMAVKL